MPMTKEETRELAHTYKRFSQTDDGKEILEDLGWFCGYNATSVLNQANPDPNSVIFCEGKRRVILRMKSFINFKENENESGGR